MVITRKGDDISMADAEFLASTTFCPVTTSRFFDRVISALTDDMTDTISGVWNAVATGFFVDTGLWALGFGDPISRILGWKSLFRKAVSLGADVHANLVNTSMPGQKTLLFELVHLEANPGQDKYVEILLSILESCGIHLPTYLGRENEICRRDWEYVEASRHNPYRSHRKLAFRLRDSLLIPNWVLWNDPEGENFIFLKEFEDLGSPKLWSGWLLFREEEADIDREEWVDHFEYFWSEDWPFCLSFRSYWDKNLDKILHLVHHDRHRAYICLADIIQLQQERFERRQAKKLGVKRRKRDPTRQMPGAYVD